MASSSDDIPRYNVEISPNAKNDLRSIYKFLEETTESTYIASRQVEMIETSILRLSVFPNGHPKYREDRPYRVCHVKKYCIMFNVEENGRVVSINRIFHARQHVGSISREVLVVNNAGVAPMTRSQAKKLLAGLERYKKIIFDFAGIEVIGQAFADEIFRVFNIHHPGIILEPINMSGSVELMVTHAQNDPTGRELSKI